MGAANQHRNLTGEQLHKPFGFAGASNNTRPFKNGNGDLVWTLDSNLESALDYVSPQTAPPSEDNGDIYLLDDTGTDYDIDTIAWQSGSTIRITFNGSPDLSAVAADDYFITSGNANSSNDGTFVITTVNDGSDYIEITNTGRTDATDDEASDAAGTGYYVLEEWDAAPKGSHVKFDGTSWVNSTVADGVICYDQTADSHRYYDATNQHWDNTIGGAAGTVTSVGGTGTINGLTLTGTVTTSGNLTLGGTLAVNDGDWSGTDLAIANGGTGQSTAQAAIDALTQVSGATDEYVLTKDTATGNATWKAASGGSSLWTDDGSGRISYSASNAAVEIYETSYGNTYGSNVTVRRGFFMVGEGHTIGDNTTATNVDRAFVAGGNHTVGNVGTVGYIAAIGYNNTIEEGLYNVAVGGTNTIKDTSDNAIAVGTSNTITGSNTIVVGNANESKSDSAIIFGDTVTAGESSKKQLAFGNNFDVAKTYFSKGFYVEFGSGGSSRPTFGLVRATGLTDTEPLNLCMGSNQAVRNDGLGGSSTNAGSGVFWQFLGDTAPSTTFTNGVAHYTADRAAGKAGYEIQTEDGTNHFFGDYSAIGGDNTVANANTILTVQGEGTGTGYGLEVEDSGGTQNLGVRDDGVIIMANLPTSSAGLPTGALWNNSGVINIA